MGARTLRVALYAPPQTSVGIAGVSASDLTIYRTHINGVLKMRRVRTAERREC